MTPRFVIRPAAEADVLEAATWYESRAPGLGLDFVGAVERCLDDIHAAPQRFPRVHAEVRRALLRRYPYGVFYVVAADAIEVIACLHCRRDPKRWQRRLWACRRTRSCCRPAG